MGNAGIARLILSCKDRDIPIWRNTSMSEIIFADRRVIGIKASQGEKDTQYKSK